MSGRRATYPREKLLTLRRGEERAGRIELARLRDQLHDEQRRLRSLEAELRSRKRGASTAAQLQAEERFRAALRERHRRTSAALERAASSLHDAVRRREAVERDHEAWEKQRRRTEVARDQRAAEESTLARFVKR